MEELQTEQVLHRAWTRPFSTKSDYARLMADAIAQCASDGYITNHVGQGQYHRCWYITEQGLKEYYAIKGISGPLTFKDQAALVSYQGKASR